MSFFTIDEERQENKSIHINLNFTKQGRIKVILDCSNRDANLLNFINITIGTVNSVRVEEITEKLACKDFLEEKIVLLEPNEHRLSGGQGYTVIVKDILNYEVEDAGKPMVFARVKDVGSNYLVDVRAFGTSDNRTNDLETGSRANFYDPVIVVILSTALVNGLFFQQVDSITQRKVSEAQEGEANEIDFSFEERLNVYLTNYVLYVAVYFHADYLSSD